MLELIRALAVTHQKGIIHRDLKPENLLVTADGVLKILDFGIAKVNPLFSGEQGDDTADTQAGTVLGTIGYLAPEQAMGDPVDERADLFAVGVILYELVTGNRAFQKATPIATLCAIAKQKPPPTGRPRLDAVLNRCLEKAPGDRVVSATELEHLLLGLLE